MTPQPRLLTGFTRLPSWGQMLCAVLLGAAGALAQAPFDYSVLILLMMIFAFMMLRACKTWRSAALRGWALGLGYFGVTLSWIISPFYIDPSTVWMAPIGLFFMAMGMGLFWALGFGIARLVHPTWGLVIAWPLAEVLRAYIFTGFAWGSPPQALVAGAVGQTLAWVGPHGLMVLLCSVAWGLATQWRKFLVLKVVLAAAVVMAIAFPVTRIIPASDTAERPMVRLVQPNAPQADKWDRDKGWSFVHRALDFTGETGNPDLIVWPETAVPALLHNAENVMQAAGQAGRGVPVALGILRVDQENMIRNALVVLDADGTVTQTYDKHHLVPFGEYIPMRAVFNAIGLHFIGDMFGDGFGRGPGAQLLDFGALGKALPLICYEAVFAHDVNAAPTRPDFLIQITNDAWFGNFAGPQQHLAQARMRAIEQGLPLARAANTGISAMIGPRGEIIAAVPLNEAGYVDAPLPKPLTSTLYSKIGDLPIAIVLTLVALMCLFGRMRGVKARKS